MSLWHVCNRTVRDEIAMDFGKLTPEVNSGRIYSGPGPGALFEAAAAWHRLAGWLRDTAAAMAMTRAAAPYLTWCNATAARAEQAADAAAAAAKAYESALAAVVPPAVVAANRARQRSLAGANRLGQMSQAIADIDAEYERMWSQDADAMHVYAGASADASRVTPFTSPPPTSTAPAGPPAAVPAIRSSAATVRLMAAPELVSAGCRVMSAIPAALQELSESPLASLGTSLAPVASSLSKLSSLSAPSDFALSHLNCLNKATALTSLLPSFLPNRGRAVLAAPTARLGRGMSIGTLSAPRVWTTRTTLALDTARFDRGWAGEPIRLVKAGEPPRWPLSQ